MRPASLALRHEVAFFNEFLQAPLHGAGLAFRELQYLAEREGFLIRDGRDDLSWRADGGRWLAWPLADSLADYSRFDTLYFGQG